MREVAHFLIEQYFNAVSRYGPDSPETLTIRAENASDAEFLALADSLDRIKRHLGGGGVGPRPHAERYPAEDAEHQYSRNTDTLPALAR